MPVTDAAGEKVKGPDGVVLTKLEPEPYFNNAPEDRPPPAPECLPVGALTDAQQAACSAKSVKLVSSELFQSVNAFFVVALTPLVVGVFAWLRRRKQEPSTPGKIALGMFITALSTLVMVTAAVMTHNGEVKGSMLWLVGTYFVVTIGELCLSPMGLSMVSKMAPRHITGLMMGGWQLATSIGNKLSGVLASMWDKYDDKATFFWVNFALLSLAALALFAMLRWLNQIFREKGLS